MSNSTPPVRQRSTALQYRDQLLTSTPWAISQSTSKYFHHQFMVTYPIFPEGEDGLLSSYLSQTEKLLYCLPGKMLFIAKSTQKLQSHRFVLWANRHFSATTPPRVETLLSCCSSISFWRRWSLFSKKHLAVLLKVEGSHALQKLCRKPQKS